VRQVHDNGEGVTARRGAERAAGCGCPGTRACAGRCAGARGSAGRGSRAVGGS